MRVGFENNLWLADGSVAADNSALVAAARTTIGTCGLSAGTADDLRNAWLRVI